MAKKILKKVLNKKSKKQAPITKQDPITKKQITNEVKENNKVKEDKKYNLTIGIKDLFDAGCHLGHKISKTHPKARTNIYVAKDGIEIINLEKTIKSLETACNFIYNARRNRLS